MSTMTAICPTCGYQHDTDARGFKKLHAEWFKALSSAMPVDKGAEQRGHERAIGRVRYWLDGHKSRLRISPDNQFIKCEINDIEELLSALEVDNKELFSQSPSAPAPAWAERDKELAHELAWVLFPVWADIATSSAYPAEQRRICRGQLEAEEARILAIILKHHANPSKE